MTHILCIETGTTTCSVALSNGNEVLDIIETHDINNNHAKNLSHFIDVLLERQNTQASKLSAVAVSKGPGSYTGLRIGVSVAKGICYGANIPLIAVGSLNSIAQGAIDWLGNNQNIETPDIICPMIDARRMEVYTQLFTTNGKSITEVEAKILDENSYADLLEKKKVLFLGNGSTKAKSVIQHTNASFLEEFNTSSRYMIPIANTKFQKNNFEDTAYFEPFYLKNFVATIPKNKVLGK